MNSLSLTAIIALSRRELLRQIRFNRDVLLGAPLMAFLMITLYQLTLMSADNIDENQNIYSGGQAMISYMAIGFLALSGFLGGFFSTAYSLAFDRIERIIDDLLMAPVTGLEIAIGYAIPAVIMGLCHAALVWLVVAIMIDPYIANPFLTLLFLAMGTMTMANIGLLCALYSQKWDHLTAKQSFIVMPLLQFAGSFFPIKAIDIDWLRQLALCNPMVYFTEGVRYGITREGQFSGVLTPSISLPTALIVSVALTIFFFAITSRLIAKGKQLKY